MVKSQTDRRTDRRTDRQTESDAYEPTVHKHRCAQKQKETRVRITGIDEEGSENLHKKIVKIAKSKLAMKKLKEHDIQEVYRAGKKQENKTRDIVVQFTKKIHPR